MGSSGNAKDHGCAHGANAWNAEKDLKGGVFPCLSHQLLLCLFAQALDAFEFFPESVGSCTYRWSIKFRKPLLPLVRTVDGAAAAVDSPAAEQSL